MRIVLHAGLHKSGTTAVQTAWRAAYGLRDGVWYPNNPKARQPGHHALVWPLLGAFTSEQAPDLVLARRRLRGGLATDALASVVGEAEAAGVDVLVISSEDLDRITARDVPAMSESLAGHDVTGVLTVTRPAHRWCAGWQELVKHGLSAYPSAAAEHVLTFAALRKGRLAEIARLLPVSRMVVRLVRTDPPEPDLAQELADVVGLTYSPDGTVKQVANRSLGTSIEIVRRINAADAGLGTMDVEAKTLLRSLRGRELDYVDVPGLERQYRFPAELEQSAQAELDFLESRDAEHLTVVDPHDLRSVWTELTPPAWYVQISRREAVVPELDVVRDPAEQLWRARQERVALRARLARAEAKLADRRATSR